MACTRLVIYSVMRCVCRSYENRWSNEPNFHYIRIGKAQHYYEKKKQLRELSEDDLKKVTGGYVQFVEPDDDVLIKVLNPTLPTVPPVGGTCPEGYMLVTNLGSSQCYQGGA